MTQEHKLCKRGHVRSPENVMKNGTCKECNKLSVKQWVDENKDKRAEITKRYRETHKEEISEQGKIYVKENKEKRDKYYKDNAEKVAAYFKEYRKRNIDKIRIYQNSDKRKESRNRWRIDNINLVRKYSRERAQLLVKAFVAPVNRLEIFERDNWTCQICDNPVDRSAYKFDPAFPTIDHIIPLSKGGTHEPANVQCAHLRCNISKHSKIEVNINELYKI